MNLTKTKTLSGLAASALLLISAPGLAGVDHSGQTPVLRGDRAPAPPLSINTFPGDSDPYAFADFPDLPGYLPPPPSQDKGPDVEESFNPLGPGVVEFGTPKRLPPDSEQIFDLPRPNWDHGFTEPTEPNSDRLRKIALDAYVGTPSGQSNIPAPGAALLLIAGGAAARRRRR